jgi:hypothetical protein
MKAPILAAIFCAISASGAVTAFAQQSETTPMSSGGPDAVSAPPAAAPGGWFAIAASSTSQGAAQQRVNQLGSGWFVMSSNDCPNFTRGYWVAVSGPFSHSDALARVGNARQSGVYDAYAKSCR